jgi:hypothetical protein
VPYGHLKASQRGAGSKPIFDITSLIFTGKIYFIFRVQGIKIDVDYLQYSNKN